MTRRMQLRVRWARSEGQPQDDQQADEEGVSGIGMMEMQIADGPSMIMLRKMMKYI